MSRTTDVKVREIIPVPASVDSLEAYRDVASLLVANVIEANHPDELEEEHLEEIERWLSAHFVAIRYTRTSQEQIGDVSENYQHKVDLDLRCTMYGQQAMLLDTTGSLAGWNNELKSVSGRTASIAWLGSKLPEQTDNISLWTWTQS